MVFATSLTLAALSLFLALMSGIAGTPGPAKDLTLGRIFACVAISLSVLAVSLARFA